jgi:hypothetical protein
LAHMIVFCEMDYVSLMEIMFRLTQTLKLWMAYWWHLNITCPQHDSTNGCAKPNPSHETT